MRSLATLALVLMILPHELNAQFGIPLPQPLDAKTVRAEDFLRLFGQRVDSSTRVAVTSGASDREARLAAAAVGFCESIKRSDADAAACRETLTLTAVEPYAAGDNPKATRVLLAPRQPFGHSRAAVAEYMRQSGASTGLALLSQFAANVSDKEAYVVTNVVRGLAGRAFFSADYAAVVTKAGEETTDEAKREEIENDKANILRMVNNGGTLVGNVRAPIHAIAGTTVSSTSAISFSSGLIGPLGDTDRLNAAGSIVGEAMSSIAIRDIGGSSEQTAELLLGGRLGYSLSDGPLRAGGGPRDVSYGQLGIGLRQNGSLSLSILVTKTNHDFDNLMPRLLVNFTAIR